MKIAFVSSEVEPFAKTGGLGDVAALPKALKNLGHDVKVFMPKYALVDHSKFDLDYDWSIGEIPIRVAGNVYNVNVYHSTLPESYVEIYFIDSPHFYNRNHIYTTDIDEDERFILFSKAVIESLQRLKWKPDVIHCNDWQTGLIPLYIKDNYAWDKFFETVATVITIHNIGYQGRFSPASLSKAEIRSELFYLNSPVETMGEVNFLKTGLMFADAINTVSETYAKEIMTYEYGSGLDGVLHYRAKDFRGIVNGVDYSVWNPETDKHIPFHFSVGDLSGKLENKKVLLKKMRLPFHENIPLIGIVSRLVSQKGFDLLENSINELMEINAQWIILGSGEERYEELFRSMAFSFPDKVSVYLGFNNGLSHLIEAGSDIFLMPSIYEPCGLNQIYSLRYGTVPVVRKTGGLADTVHDWNNSLEEGEGAGNGFTFDEPNSEELISTVNRAVSYFNNKIIWNKIIRNGMIKNYSWDFSANKYLELYKHAISNRRKS
ncbi:MAG: glycogen synthase GlgA [Chlorobiaceae bacterium]|nr:glycogen synthase GlgA [Chlorobiaceae bacterium]